MINLDALEQDELDDARRVFVKLAHYADIKRVACEHRLAGKIDEALWCERHCEDLYNQLPVWARW